MRQSKDLLKRVDDHLVAESIWPCPERLRSNLGFYFRGMDLVGKSVLEIGAGSGTNAIYCAALGAKRVVAIEPESAGATSGVARDFLRFAEAVDLEGRVDYAAFTFEQFIEQYDGEPFDFIFMQAVVNHFDEAATEQLHRRDAVEERQSYAKRFVQMFQLTAPGGHVILSDVGRKNGWNTLRLRSPFAPTIEWHKHQQPDVWQSLLTEAGYQPLDCLWLAPYRLRRLKLGWLLNWPLPAWFMDSFFVLRCQRSPSE